jgi:heat shock protein HslJ
MNYKSILSILFLGILFSCHCTKDVDKEVVSETKKEVKEVVETKKTDSKLHDIWVLEKYYGEKPELTISELPRIELNSTELRVSGKMICNQVMGGYANSGNTIEFKQLALTRMACGQTKVSENELVQKLQQKFSYKISNLRLHLIQSDGKEAFVFRKID